MAGRDDLVLKVSADTSAVASGLKPMSAALEDIEQESERASESLEQLAKLDVSVDVDSTGLADMQRQLEKVEQEAESTQDALRELSRTEVEIDIREQAIQKARQDIDRLKDSIAEDVILGLDTRTAQRELSTLQSSVKKLTTEKHKVEILVEPEGVIDKTASGMEGLREGVRETSGSLVSLNQGFTGIALVTGAALEGVSDLNEYLRETQLRAEEAGKSTGRLQKGITGITGFLSGPWGLAVAAGTILVGEYAQSQTQAEQAVQALSDSIDFQAGAFERANRETAAKMLNDATLLELAEKNQISTQDMVSALLGEEDALGRVNAQFDAAAKRHPAFASFIEKYKEDFDDLRITNEATATTQQRLGRAVGETNEDMQEQRIEIEKQLPPWQEYAGTMNEARTELDKMIASFDILNGRFATTREATANYEQDLDDLNAALKENKKTLDLGQESGRKNDALIQKTAADIAKLAEARLKDADSSGESSKQILADYEKQRASLIKTAEKMGLSRKEAEKYVDQLLATPEELETQAKVTGVDKANAQIKELTKDREVHIEATLGINASKFAEMLRRGIRAAEAEAAGGSLSARPTTMTVAPQISLTPRLYLDSRPIRAAMRSDITTTVQSTVASATRRGRL